MSLCPSLSAFRFSPDSNLDLGILNPVDDDLPPPRIPEFPEAILPGHINAQLDGADDDVEAAGFGEYFDYGGDAGEEEDFFAAENNNNGAAHQDRNFETGDDNIEPFDPRRTGHGESGERDLVISTAGNGEQMFDHFDSASIKNWAGPEHWKMRRVAVKKGESNHASLISRAYWETIC